jgi:PAS domain S-box-containing protein
MDYTILSGRSSAPLPALTQSTPALDGILLEFGVPHTHGLHLLRQLKEQTSAPVVVIDGGETEVAVQALKMGAVDYLVKDRTTPDDLRLAMRTAIENAELKRELQRSQETFLTSVENMLDCFGIFSAMRDDAGQIVDFRIDYLNAAACENNQIPKEMQIGRGLCEVLPAHRESGLFDEYCQVVETGEPLIKDSLIYDDTYGDRRLMRAFDIRASKLKDGFVASWRDVTDRKQLELELSQTVAELQSSQQHNQDLAEAMPQMVWTADASGAVNYWNQAWYEYSGLSEAASFGLTGVRTVHPEEREYVLAQWSRAVTHGQPIEIEYRIRNHAGEYRWFICRATPTRDRQHQITGWIGTITDIDEQKQTSLALQKSQERLELAMKAASMGSWDWNIQTGEVRWSNNLEHLFGMAPGEFDGRYETVQAMIHPEDLPKFEQAIQRALDEGEEYNFEFRFIKPDGSVRWALGLGRVFYDDDGNPVMMTGVDGDITARKQAEAAIVANESRLQGFVEANVVGILHGDIHGNINAANDQLLSIIGYTQDDVQSGRLRWIDITPPEYLALDQQGIAEARDRGACTPYEKEYIRKDGSRVPVLIGYSLVGEAQEETVVFVLDLSDRKQAERQLQESESRLQLGMKVAGFALAQIDYSTNLVHLLPETAALYGLPANPLTITREQLHDTFHPADRAQLEQRIEAILDPAGEGWFAQDHRVLLNNGKVKWLTVRKQVFFDQSSSPPQPSHAILAALDITDRKQTERDLQENVSRFRTLADNMSQLAWMANEVGWIFWYNQRWFDYTGTTLEEMQGWGWQQVHHPDHLERVVEKINQCFTTGEVWEDTFPLRGKDGTYRWFLSRAVPIRDERGRVLRWFGTNTDITELREIEKALRQSEERYRRLADSIPQLVWTANDTGELLDVNQRWTAFTGLDLAQAQTDGWEAVVHPEDVPILMQHWTIAAQQGTPYQAAGRMRQADGTYRWFLHQAIPQRDEQGQLIKWLGTAPDIARQKQLELERDRLLVQEQAARSEAERANRIKDEFLAILSHELRSPLNPILGWASLLQKRQFDAATTAQALATIERNAKLQTQLIDDLLDVAKILRGKLLMEMASVDLALVIESAIETMADAAAAKSIQVHAVLPSIGHISGDPVRLQQVVWNLLSNAIKFTPQAGRVDILLERADNQARIIVSDTGKGIKPEFLQHLFESFRQEDASTTRKYGGLGLGLAIVRYLVEAHGGTITAHSLGEGQGATFIVCFPLIDTEPEMPQSEPYSIQELDLTGIRVLAVDDEPDARELLATVLTMYGAEVLTVTSAAEVLNALESFHPDVLISDIGMPDINGHSLIRQIRALPADQGGQIPAIALTAYAREEDHQQAIASGFQQQVTKPLDPEKLVQEVVVATRK